MLRFFYLPLRQNLDRFGFGVIGFISFFSQVNANGGGNWKKVAQSQKVITKQRKEEKKKKKALVPFLAIEQYNLYWVKLRGYPSWPAVVEGRDGSMGYNVHFFSDYTKAKVQRGAFVSGFKDGFIAFSKKPKQDPKLAKAAK